MIIIEGPDNSGKSTLGAQLTKKLNIPTIHSAKPDPAWTQEEALRHALDSHLPKDAILDRTYTISELVYGPICRGGSALGDLHFNALRDLYSRSHLIIYCRPPLEKILDNQGRDQMDGVIENHQKLVERYDEVMYDLLRFSTNRVVWYDWTVLGNLISVLERCQDHLLKQGSVKSSALYQTKFKREV